MNYSSHSDSNQKFGHVDRPRTVSVELVEDFQSFFIGNFESRVMQALGELLGAQGFVAVVVDSAETSTEPQNACNGKDYFMHSINQPAHLKRREPSTNVAISPRSPLHDPRPRLDGSCLSNRFRDATSLRRVDEPFSTNEEELSSN